MQPPMPPMSFKRNKISERHYIINDICRQHTSVCESCADGNETWFDIDSEVLNSNEDISEMASQSFSTNNVSSIDKNLVVCELKRSSLLQEGDNRVSCPRKKFMIEVVGMKETSKCYSE